MLSPTTHRFSALTAVLSTVRMGPQAQKGCRAIKSEHVWSHCFPSVCVKKRLILNSLSFRHRLTSFGHLQVNEASAGTKQGSQALMRLVDVSAPNMDGSCLLWHRKSLVWRAETLLRHWTLLTAWQNPFPFSVQMLSTPPENLILQSCRLQ